MRSRHRRARCVSALCALLLLSGCFTGTLPSNHTTLQLADGSEMRGTIVRADAAAHTIDFEQAPEWTFNVFGVPVGPTGRQRQLATAEVIAIEHVEPHIIPFNWSMVALGAALAIGGAVWAASDDLETTEDKLGAGALMLFGPALVIGGGIFAVRAHLHAAESQRLWQEALGPPAPPGAAPGGGPAARLSLTLEL